MAQTIVIENDRFQFWKKCGELLDAGWEVIPGTVVTAIATTSADGDSERHIAFFTDNKKENQ